MKRFHVILIITVGSVLAFALINKTDRPGPSLHANSLGETHAMTIYKSPTCGCCANYAAYVKARGYMVEVVDLDDMDELKRQNEIPEELYSCHTTLIDDGDYFVEGHIPLEVIDRLMEEKPAIKGIGMPGMPAASPGMLGAKAGPFQIFQVPHSGHYELYMSL